MADIDLRPARESARLAQEWLDGTYDQTAETLQEMPPGTVFSVVEDDTGNVSRYALLEDRQRAVRLDTRVPIAASVDSIVRGAATITIGWHDLDDVAAGWAGGATEIEMSAPAVAPDLCPECGAPGGRHSMVHVRHAEGGGGYNRPCSRMEVSGG